MSQRISYTKIENELWPEYRDRLNKAESTEDVKKFFVYAATELFEKILQQDDLRLDSDDIQLHPESKPPYSLSSRLTEGQRMREILSSSDLEDILQRMANTAAKRYVHLSRNPEKGRSGTFYR